MLATVVTVVWTHDLSLGVLAGVLLSGIFFAAKVRDLVTIETSREGATRHYVIAGQIFFASVDRITEAMEFNEAGVTDIDIDVTHAHFWDISATGVLDKVVGRLQGEGKRVRVIGLNKASATLIEKYSDTEKPFQSLGVVGGKEVSATIRVPEMGIEDADPTPRGVDVVCIAGRFVEADRRAGHIGIIIQRCRVF